MQEDHTILLRRLLKSVQNIEAEVKIMNQKCDKRKADSSSPTS